MNNISFDATLLSSLQGCARFTENRFIKLWVQESKSNSLEAGILVHTILEYYSRAIMEGKSRSDAIEIGYNAGKLQLVGCPTCINAATVTGSSDCTLHKNNEWTGLKAIPEKSNKHSIGAEHIFSTLAQYFDYYRADTFTILATEETRGKIIYEDSELRILWKAKFDNIIDTPSGIMSRDYKTMKQRRDTLDLNNQFMGQCLLTGARQVMVDKIGFQTSLKPEEKFTRVIIPYSLDRLVEFATEIVPYYARMLVAYTEAGYFPPNFTHCETKYGFCDYKDICQLDRGMRDEAFKINFVQGKVWDV